MTSLARVLARSSGTPKTVTGAAPTRGRGAITRSVLAAVSRSRGDSVTFGGLFDRLGPEGMGLALLLLTLPTLIPVPGPIGMTFGTLISFVALQVMAGRRALWLPAILRRRTLPVATLRGVIARALPWLSYSERWLREGRLAPIAGHRARIVLAVPLLLLAAAIALPIPLGNYAPALALIAFSLGFMARDGAAVLVALLLGIAAVAWTGVLFLTGAAVIDHMMGLVGW